MKNGNLLKIKRNYWHGHPKDFPKPNAIQRKAIKNDKFKDQLAALNGYKIIRVWESDFKNEPSKVKERLLKEINEE